MRFLCARQAWHDAFMTDLAAPDFATQAANVGVQKTARGADNAIVDHCERGFIIAAVHRLREVDYIAYCWGMIAYAPQGTANFSEFSAMHGFLRDAFFEWLPAESEVRKLRHNPIFERRLKLLAKVAAMDAGAEDARQGQEKELLKVHRRLTADLAQLLGVGHGEYMGKWHKFYKMLKRHCGDELPKRALPIVAAEVNRRKKPGDIMLTPGVQTVGDVSQVDIDAKLIGELTEALSVCESAAEAKKAAKRFVGTIGLRE